MDSKLGHALNRTTLRSAGFIDRPGQAGGLRRGAGLRYEGQGWAAWRPAAVRRSVWSSLLLAAAVLALLLAFHQVVSGAVVQGESRRQATAALADATWRCKALRSGDDSRECLAQLQAQSGTVKASLTQRAIPVAQL